MNESLIVVGVLAVIVILLLIKTAVVVPQRSEYIVGGNAILRRDVHHLFFKGALVCDLIKERDENMKACAKRRAVLAQSFNDVGVLLRHNDRNLEDDDQGNKCKYQ